jgi:hypothetical protein
LASGIFTHQYDAQAWRRAIGLNEALDIARNFLIDSFCNGFAVNNPCAHGKSSPQGQ